MPSPSSRLADRIRLQFRVWSAFYDSPFFQRGYYGRVHRRLVAAIDARGVAPPADVLDLGCGTGELLRVLARKWPEARLVGLDLSPEMLAHAQRKDYGGANVQLTEGSVYELPFEDGAFDLVTNTISSHFYKDLEPALAEIARVIRPGGHFVMAALTNGPLAHVTDELRGLQAAYRSPQRLREALTHAGFTVHRAEPVAWPSWLFVARLPT